MTIRCAAILLAALTLFACGKDDAQDLTDPAGGNSGNNTNAVCITATIASDNASATASADTRIGIEDPGNTALKLTWTVGDVIFAARTGDATIYPFTAIEIRDNGKTAVFRAPENYPGEEAPALAVWSGSSAPGR